MKLKELLREFKLSEIEATDEYGNTALHLAVKSKTFTQKKIVEVLEYLLNKGINLNTKNKENQTVLHIAVAYRMKDVVYFLMSRKINMDSIPHFFIEDEYLTIQDFLTQMNDLDEWHGGILRMQTESVHFLEWLILKGFDFDRKNQENKSALNMAIEHNLQYILPVLLKYTKDIDYIGKENIMKMAKLLRELNLTDIEVTDKYGNTAFHIAVKNKTFTQKQIVQVIEVLIGRGMNPDSKNNKNQTALHLAVLYRMKDVINCLMAHKVNLDLVAHFFVEHEYVTLQEWFAQMDNLDEWYGEMLRMESESIEFAEWLISKGIDFDCKNQENGSALNMAIKYNLQHILPVLLKYTKDIDFVDKEYKTLLHLFLQKNFTSTYSSTKSINKKWYAERYAAEIVKIFLDRGLSADAEDIYKLTPIQIAIAKEEDIGVVQILIKQCLNIHHRDSHNETMFQVVVRYFLSASESRSNYYLTILCCLIAKGADVNEVYELDKYGYTALCYAVLDRNMRLINFLEENGADFGVTTKDGKNLQHLLALSTVTMKARRDADGEGRQVNAPSHEFVFYDDSADNVAVIQKLMEYGVKMEDCIGERCMVAIRKGDISLMGLLEKNGVDFCVSTKHKVDVSKLVGHDQPFSATTKSDENLLHLHANTSNNTSTKLFNLLISKGCEVNAKDMQGSTPLHEAVSHDNEAVAEKLIEHGAEVNCETNDGMTPLHIASRRKSIRILELLRENGAKFDAKTKDGETLMHLLFKSSEIKDEKIIGKIFDLLKSNGCKFNVKDKSGNYPIHLAAEHTNVAVMRMLIQDGADVNSRNNQRETPLHLATMHRKAAKLGKVLLAHGANVNAKDSRGQTPLHKAAVESGMGNCQMLWTLLKYGADVNALDAKGLSAFSFACFRERKLSLEWECRVSVDLASDDSLHYFPSDQRFDSNEFLCLEFSQRDGWHLSRKTRCLHSSSTEGSSYEKIGPQYDYGDNDSLRHGLVRHSMKLKAANLPWDSKIDNLFNDSEEIKNLDEKYYEKCLKEIETLRSTFVDGDDNGDDNDRTSLYTLLHMNFDRRRAFVHNEKLRKLVDSPVLTERFPKYFVLILASYRDAVMRESLLKQAREVWLELTKIYLPVELLEFIFSFLSNADLFDIIEKD